MEIIKKYSYKELENESYGDLSVSEKISMKDQSYIDHMNSITMGKKQKIKHDKSKKNL